VTLQEGREWDPNIFDRFRDVDNLPWSSCSLNEKTVEWGSYGPNKIYCGYHGVEQSHVGHVSRFVLIFGQQLRKVKLRTWDSSDLAFALESLQRTSTDCVVDLDFELPDYNCSEEDYKDGISKFKSILNCGRRLDKAKVRIGIPGDETDKFVTFLDTLEIPLLQISLTVTFYDLPSIGQQVELYTSKFHKIRKLSLCLAYPACKMRDFDYDAYRRLQLYLTKLEYLEELKLTLELWLWGSNFQVPLLPRLKSLKISVTEAFGGPGGKELRYFSDELERGHRTQPPLSGFLSDQFPILENVTITTLGWSFGPIFKSAQFHSVRKLKLDHLHQ